MVDEHVDVVVVGAGLSGIAAGYYLQTRCPDKTFVVLEARDGIGGTWDKFRYPGIRSDSDMYTLGLPFEPWVGDTVLASGPQIRNYLEKVTAKYRLRNRIRLGHKVVRAHWSTPEQCWILEVQTGSRKVEVTCSILYSCTGYYDYDNAHRPLFPGEQRFPGPIIHPQDWTEDTEYAGKRIAVIGSGATAVTMVPALAEAAHVTMVQRSPGYIVPIPQTDNMSRMVRRILPQRVAAVVMRWKNIARMLLTYNAARRDPDRARAAIRHLNKAALPPGYDVDTHFNPSYDVWDQRLCVVPDGDLFRAIRTGRARVATGEIDTFTETGLRLRTGEDVAADMIVTATGLSLIAWGGMEIRVDGQHVDPGSRRLYKGMLVEDIPNFATATGYTNGTWTLKAAMTGEYLCRLINHLDARKLLSFTPHNDDPSLGTESFTSLTSGYIVRALDRLPKNGTKSPWRLLQNYPLDYLSVRFGRIDDGVLKFESSVPQPVRG